MCELCLTLYMGNNTLWVLSFVTALCLSASDGDVPLECSSHRSETMALASIPVACCDTMPFVICRAAWRHFSSPEQFQNFGQSHRSVCRDIPVRFRRPLLKGRPQTFDSIPTMEDYGCGQLGRKREDIESTEMNSLELKRWHKFANANEGQRSATISPRGCCWALIYSLSETPLTDLNF